MFRVPLDPKMLHYLHPLDAPDTSPTIVGRIHGGPLLLGHAILIVGLLNTGTVITQ